MICMNNLGLPYVTQFTKLIDSFIYNQKESFEIERKQNQSSTKVWLFLKLRAHKKCDLTKKQNINYVTPWCLKNENLTGIWLWGS